jgi:hypothetical protein
MRVNVTPPENDYDRGYEAALERQGPATTAINISLAFNLVQFAVILALLSAAADFCF